MHDKNFEEKRRHTSGGKLFSYYASHIPKYFSCIPLHWHGEFEINYILDGRAEFVCGDERFVANKGDIIIILPNMFHAAYPYKNNSQLFETLVFNPDMLGADSHDRSAVELVRPLLNNGFEVKCHITSEHCYYRILKTIIENIFSCAKGNETNLDILMKAQLMEFYWLLLEIGNIYPKSKDISYKSDIVRPVIKYINDNFKNEISIDVLADTVNLSKSYFMKIFKQLVGTSASEYIIQLRVQNACKMLLKGCSAADSAYESGFGTLSNFNRQFKKIMGCTPMEYKGLNR